MSKDSKHNIPSYETWVTWQCDPLEEDFAQTMHDKGVTIYKNTTYTDTYPAMAWGNGSIDSTKFAEAHPQLQQESLVWYELMRLGKLDVSWGAGRSRYMTFQVDSDVYPRDTFPSGLFCGMDIYEMDMAEGKYEDFDTALKNIIRGYYHEFAKRCEAEFEFQTSEEMYREYIAANYELESA